MAIERTNLNAHNRSQHSLTRTGKLTEALRALREANEALHLILADNANDCSTEDENVIRAIIAQNDNSAIAIIRL